MTENCGSQLGTLWKPGAGDRLLSRAAWIYGGELGGEPVAKLLTQKPFLGKSTLNFYFKYAS